MINACISKQLWTINNRWKILCTTGNKLNLKKINIYIHICMCPKCAKIIVNFSENSREIPHVGSKSVGSKWLRFCE